MDPFASPAVGTGRIDLGASCCTGSNGGAIVVYVLDGRVNAQGVLELGEHAPLPEGPVRVSVEPLRSGFSGAPSLLIAEEEWSRRKRSLDGAIGCLSDEDAREIRDVIEREFEQVNLDDSRRGRS
jgi:hypothetical protein